MSTDLGETLKCPYCKARQDVSISVEGEEGEEHVIRHCDECGKAFVVRAYTKVSITAHKIA